MAVIELPEWVGKPIGLYDEDAPGAPEVLAVRAVDITDHCPHAQGQAILCFARDSRGSLVQMRDAVRSDGEGRRLHFRLTVDSEADLQTEMMFAQWAGGWGIFSPLLARTIFDNMPS